MRKQALALRSVCWSLADGKLEEAAGAASISQVTVRLEYGGIRKMDFSTSLNRGVQFLAIMEWSSSPATTLPRYFMGSTPLHCSTEGINIVLKRYLPKKLVLRTWVFILNPACPTFM